MRFDALQARALRAKGITYLVRHVDENFGQHPDTTSEMEVRILREQGIDVLLMFGRSAPSEQVRDRDRGIEDGNHALSQCRIVGYEVGMPLLFLDDTEAYFGGVREAVGDYHPLAVVMHPDVKEVSNGEHREARDLVQVT